MWFGPRSEASNVEINICSTQEAENFIYQNLAREFGSENVEAVSVHMKGPKAYAFVTLARMDLTRKAVDFVQGLKFGTKKLGAQVHQQRTNYRNRQEKLDWLDY